MLRINWIKLLWDIIRDAFDRAVSERRFETRGFILFCGRKRMGKTGGAVAYVLRSKRLYPDLTIASNIRLEGVPYIPFSTWEELIALIPDEYDDDRYPGGLLVLWDELHLQVSSAVRDPPPFEMLSMVSQQGHLRTEVVGTAQVYERVTLAIREQVDIVVLAKPYFHARLLRHQWFHADEYEDWRRAKGMGRKSKIKRLYTEFIHFTDDLRYAYNTYEVVRSMKAADRETRRLRARQTREIVDSPGNLPQVADCISPLSSQQAIDNISS